MSVIHVKCMQCGKEFNVKAEFAGKKGKCPVCGKVINIPDPAMQKKMALGVNTDLKEDERKSVAREVAMGPQGYMVKPKVGFFARLFGRKK